MILFKRGTEYILGTGDDNGVIYDSSVKRLTGEAPIDVLLAKGGWEPFSGDPAPIMAETTDAATEEKYVDPYTEKMLKTGKWQDLIITHGDGKVDDVTARESSSSSSA